MNVISRHPQCCELGRISIKWRTANEFHGPKIDGWSMISHLMTGTPEFANVKGCPFCYAMFDKQKPEDTI